MITYKFFLFFFKYVHVKSFFTLYMFTAVYIVYVIEKKCWQWNLVFFITYNNDEENRHCFDFSQYQIFVECVMHSSWGTAKLLLIELRIIVLLPYKAKFALPRSVMAYFYIFCVCAWCAFLILRLFAYLFQLWRHLFLLLSYTIEILFFLVICFYWHTYSFRFRFRGTVFSNSRKSREITSVCHMVLISHFLKLCLFLFFFISPCDVNVVGCI